MVDHKSMQDGLEIIYQRLCTKETKLTADLMDLFKGQTKLLSSMSAIKSSTPDMSAMQGNIDELKSLVNSSSDLAKGVCREVKEYDKEKNETRDRLSRIKDIIDLKSCREGVKESMQKENYEEAAIHIKRFLSINEHDLRKTLNVVYQRETNTPNAAIEESVDLQSMKTACDELNYSKYDLLEIMRTQLEMAIMEDNFKNIERYFKIFPLINEHTDGLERYSGYLSTKLVSTSLQEKLNSKTVSQADKLAGLYENVANLIDSHQPFVETYYGPGHLLVVVKALQAECDRLARKLLEEFRDMSKLQFIVKSVKLANSPTNNNSTNRPNSNNSTRLDPREIDNVLREISIIISRTEVYLNFVTDKTKHDMEAKYVEQDVRETKLTELYNQMNVNCELGHLVQELGGIYVLLEQYYLQESSQKAIDIDQLENETSFVTSSMLDDVFFIIKKCTKRALSTKSSDIFCAVNNHCVTLLESTFADCINERLKNRYHPSESVSSSSANLDLSRAYIAIQTGRYLQSSSDMEKSRALFLSAVNNLDKAEDYIDSLKSMLEIGVKKLKVQSLLHNQQEHQKEKLASCLNDLLLINRRFKNMITSALYRLFNSIINPKFNTVLDAILEENPDVVSNLISAGEHSSFEELSRLSTSVLTAVDPSLKTSLTPKNFSELVSITEEFVDGHLKKYVKSKVIN